uniref:Uncharacterized protein n=1 Tax=Arundo donax TaxID=35708 RepID=A0A0A9CPL1_ARUDO
MGITRTEVNLLRLLDSAPRQQNQTKLVHELLEQLSAQSSSEGISSEGFFISIIQAIGGDCGMQRGGGQSWGVKSMIELVWKQPVGHISDKVLSRV